MTPPTPDPKPHSRLFELLPARPVIAHPGVVRTLGPSAALLVGQLLYWQSRVPAGQWLYKTETKMAEETGLSRHAQRTAIQRLVALSVLTVEYGGLFNRRNFRVDLDALVAACTREVDKPVRGASEDQSVDVLLSSPLEDAALVSGPIEDKSSEIQTPKTESAEIESREKESTQERKGDLRTPAELARNSRALDRVREELMAKGILQNSRGGDHA